MIATTEDSRAAPWENTGRGAGSQGDHHHGCAMRRVQPGDVAVRPASYDGRRRILIRKRQEVRRQSSQNAGEVSHAARLV